MFITLIKRSEYDSLIELIWVFIAGQLPSSLPELVYQVNGSGFYNPATAPVTPRPVELRLTIEKGLPSVYSKVGQYP